MRPQLFLQHGLDEEYGITNHVQAYLADRRDSVLLESIVDRCTSACWRMNYCKLVADTNYPNGVNYDLLEG